MRHYSDFFKVDDEYRPMMTREEINRSPDRWLDFYPHIDFETICKTLLSVLTSGAKSVWITGNLGTGKSNASLVIQKLFMDNELRVRTWFDQNATNGLSDRESLEKSLFDHRQEGTLVVYDYNADNIPRGNGLLVRLQKGIISALNERKMSIPAMSSVDTIIERIEREGDHLFKTRDKIQNQLAFLTPDIDTTSKLVNALRSETSSRLLSDVERVLIEDSIYLSFDVPMFRKWLNAILGSNDLKSVVYLFDEFHPFIETHSEQLKTFEDVTESPGINRFFLVPITHMQLTAYMAEGSKNYLRANDRFYFCNMQMPNDTAFYLARRAINDLPKPAAEWKDAKDELWDSVRQIIERFNRSDDPKRERFYDILPIHPMAAFLLKHLSEQAKSNQRSFFEYLKGGADDTSFQDFIRDGGPGVPNKQYLTVDYLWNFFLGNRKELGVDNEIKNIAAFYKQTKERLFQNQTEDAPELRILKAVLLFCLLDKLAPGGHDRLRPTVENIEMSFKGDGTIADPVGIIEELEKKHCFSVTNGNISLFSISTVTQEDIEKYRKKFHDLLHEKVEAKLEEQTKKDRKYSSGRFDIRVSDASHTTLTNINQATRDRYTEKINKDDSSVCLWFVIAKDYNEQLVIPQKIDSMLTQLNDHRILMFTFPNLSFCHSNKNLWMEYIRQYAQYMTENNTTAKSQIRSALDEIEDNWIKELRKNDTIIRVHQYKGGSIVTSDIGWSQLRELITSYVRKTLKFSVDHLGFRDEHFNNSHLQIFAKAGMTLTTGYSPALALINKLKADGLTEDLSWFTQNPDHPLGAIHALFEKKFANTVGRGGQQSIRVIYIELKRAPYGLRYNALSAFVLGYCLRDILLKNYRWTNGQRSDPLDMDTLAEIIETVVKDDGNNKIGNKEKEICQLSKADKEFIKKAPLMFGATPIANATIESVLTQIQGQVEAESAKVPLWILPEFVRAQSDPKADDIENVLTDICMAFTTSSKGEVEDRVNAVRNVGDIILGDLDIVREIAGYTNKENFLRAFEIYVDKVNPQLSVLAKQIGDISHDYCRTILDRCQETTGWLWNQADITREIDDILCEYEIISLAKSLCGYTEFTEYGSVFNALKNAVTDANHLPKQLIESFRPMLTDFLSAMDGTGSAKDIKLALRQSFVDIQRLFFDHTKAESLLILKSKLNDVTLEDSDLLSLLNEMVGGFGLDENAFLTKIRIKIEEFEKHSVVLKIKGEWTRISDTATPAEWAMKNCIPSRYIFGSVSDTFDLLKAIEQPETFAAVKLAETLEILKSVKAVGIQDCQNALKADVLPAKYKKFEISLASLLEYLQGKFGNQPNNWPTHPNIDDFITSQYKGAIAPQILEKINSKNAEDLKQSLLELAKENPELGLLFWEG
jgi:hypothetical protein